MMDTTILDKIRKLLALSKDQSDMPEGERALEIAESLMAKYNLTLTEVEMSEFQIDGYRYPMDISWSWRKALLSVLCRHFDVQPINLGSGVRYVRDRYVCLVGPKEVADVVEFMFATLARYINTMYKRRTDRSSPNSFGLSAVQAIATRLVDMKRQRFEQEQHVEGLVHVRANIDDAIAKAVTRMFPALTKGRKTRSASGSYDGYEAGKNAPLNTGVGGGTRTTLALKS